MTIAAISDTHSLHDRFIIPPCDVLIHAGDIGKYTHLEELDSFLKWFERQPAEVKIFIAGNHDIVLDKKKASIKMSDFSFYTAMNMIEQYKSIKYLNNREYVYKGIKFFGSPYSPSFHREKWAFNADRGKEIQKVWSTIPSDVNVLITHTPPYNIQDWVGEEYRENEDVHVGCKDLFGVIKKRLFNLQLHIFGHIHSGPYGCTLQPVSNTRNVLFYNASALNNEYKPQIKTPLIVTI